MNSKKINFILDNYKGIRRDRALKIESHHLNRCDKEYCQYLKNELVRIRKSIIEVYMKIETLYEYRKIHLRNLEYFEGKEDIVNAAEIQLKISEIVNQIVDFEKFISEMGRFLVTVLRANILTEHEICQLFNINEKTWENKKAEYLGAFEGKEDNAHLAYSILTINCPEYRIRKGREKGIYDCPKHEMPIYWAVHEYVLDLMKNNEGFKSATFKKFKELHPEVRICKVVKDLEGNINEVKMNN